MRFLSLAILCLILAGCNSVYIKSGTLDKSELIYAPRGGYSMQRLIKETMEKRGYNVSIGKLVRVSEVTGNEAYQIPSSARYAVNVKERNEKLRPIWCMFNGFWWWSFNVSVIDRKDNNEILTWRGRGCANSSLRKLNDILDELEMKESDTQPIQKVRKSKKKTQNLAVLAPKKQEPNLVILAKPQ